MNKTNRIKRLSIILTLLSKGNSLSTPDLVKRFSVTKKIIQTDLKDYLIPLFNDEKIYYDYSSKTYKAKNNFLTKTLFNSDELAIICILKNKSRDKYSDIDLSTKANALFSRFEDELTNEVYQKTSIERFDEFKEEIIQIKNAIEHKYIIKCIYNKKHREVYPLEILNLEGFWYLIIYDPFSKKIKTFHLNTIKDIEILHTTYSFVQKKIELFDNAITVYYKPEEPPLLVQLYVDAQVSRFLLRKPLNPTQRVIKKYGDNSIELEVTITDLMEIIPTIQRYLPFIGVITPNELKIKVKNNLDTYIKRFE